MPPSTFTDNELRHLRKHLDEWRKLKSQPEARQRVKGQKRPKDELVERACNKFFEKFPARDPYQGDPGPTTFTEEQVRQFPTTIRQWLNNNTKDTPSAPSKSAALPSKSNKTARHIAQKQYAAQIEQQAKVLVSERPGMHILTARNLATTACIQRIQEDSPDEWAEFEKLACDIRTAHAVDYTDQRPEVIQDLLKAFPKVLLNQTAEWSRTMGVLIYTMAVFATPDDPTLKSYLVLSPRLQPLQGTPTDDYLRNKLLDWIEDNLGNQSSGRVEHAAPTVYPDRAAGLRPRLPEVDDVKTVDRVLLRSWVRLYLNYLWQWLGGKGPVPWKRISRAEGEQYVEAIRLPADILDLCDPHLWTRAQILSWYTHLIAGQCGRLSSERIFQFLRVDRGEGDAPLYYRELCVTRPSVSTLTWGPDEKLYALKIAGEALKTSDAVAWCGLPLARTQAIYVPFDDALKEVISAMSTPQVVLGRLCELLSEMERLGPVHASPPTLLDGLNRHLPAGLPDSDLCGYVTDGWLPVAFFDESSPDWFALTLPALMTWIQSENQFRHGPSKTWRGGPNGVRWIVAVLARCTATFTLLNHDDHVPDDIQRHFKPHEHDRNWEQLAKISAWLVTSLEQSNLKLTQTFRARATAWKEAIIKAHLTAALSDEDEGAHAVSTTDGIPATNAEIRRIYQSLAQTDPDITLGDEEHVELQPAASPLPKRSSKRKPPVEAEAEFTDTSDSSDAEEINFPSSSSDESNDTFDEADTAFANDSFRIVASNDDVEDLSDPQEEGGLHGPSILCTPERTTFSLAPEPALSTSDVHRSAISPDEAAGPITPVSDQHQAITTAPRGPGQDDASQHEAGEHEGDSPFAPVATTSGGNDSDSGTLATRRTRRKIVVDERVKEALKTGRKGRMPPRKTPLGRPVGKASQRRKIQSYDVTRSGPRNEVTIAPAKAAASSSGLPAASGDGLLTGDALLALHEGPASIAMQPHFADLELELELEVPLAEPPEVPLEPCVAELEELLDDVHDTFTATRTQGKGQNQMLSEWAKACSDTYLREMYLLHAPPDGAACSCGDAAANFHCTDCLYNRPMCEACLTARHRYMPTHRVEEWVGTAWSKKSLMDLDLVFALGDHDTACKYANIRPFTLGDITGFHRLMVAFCRCPDAPLPYIQLLRRRILPCSEETPSTGFTFGMLRQFHLATVDSKLSAHRFYTIIQRSTNNIMPHRHLNRFREFTRATREWMYLQDHKRAGTFNALQSSGVSIALRCPACPRLMTNYVPEDVVNDEEYLYWQELSYDGSFQLVRKNKAFDQFDTCLSEGSKYWVDMESFRNHLRVNEDTAYAQSTRGSECNNHRAANDTWVRHTGVAESGVGAVTCARHTFYMPGGVVSYYKGERFTNTDYAIGSVISLLMREGASSIGVFYDIYCHWYKNFWARSHTIQLPDGPLTRPSHFFGGIPKYHLAGHTDGCYAQFSLNNMFGVGRLDAEGCERAWADLNQASGSTSERGPGSRIDALNHCMHDWNWRKTIGMVSQLITKWEEAVRMASEQKEMWLAFNESLDTTMTSTWEQMSTAPRKEGNTWKSVFLASENSSTSITRALLELNKLETQYSSLSKDQEIGYTAPSWISDGIDIEIQQRRVLDELKGHGKHPTDRQTLELFRARSSLSSRIIKHRNDAALFIDVLPGSHTGSSLAEETDGCPELAGLYLPSQLAESLQLTARSKHAKELELKLRRVACLRGLQHLRTASIHKAQLTESKRKNARGEIVNTRAQTMISRLAGQVDFAVWEYEHSRKALGQLSPSADDMQLFQPVRSADLSGLTNMLRADRDVGEGRRRLPWFFQLRAESGDASDPSGVEELNEVTRVEWFRGRERFRRWQEEERWLRREMASTIYAFAARASDWERLSESDNARFHPGYKAYVIKQRDAWQSLHKDALKRCYHILQTEPQLAICMRLCKEFEPPISTTPDSVD